MNVNGKYDIPLYYRYRSSSFQFIAPVQVMVAPLPVLFAVVPEALVPASRSAARPGHGE